MAETYSLATTGLRADTEFTAKTIKMPDSACQGNYTANSGNNQFGGLSIAMQLGSQILCKNADGSQAWYTLDAERSTPSVPVLKAV